MKEFRKQQKEQLEKHKRQLNVISALSAIFLVVAAALLVILYFYYGSADETRMKLCALGLCISVAAAVILGIIRKVIEIKCKDVTENLERTKEYQ